MSFQSQNHLASDVPFQHRITACAVGQANVFKDDARPDFVALAHSVLRVEAMAMPTFYSMAAAAPGFADDVDPDGDGTVDSSLIDDPAILAAVQGLWPTVAALFYDAEGSPLP